MPLNTPPLPPPRRSVPLALALVVLLVVAGVAVAATAAYFELSKGSGASPGPGTVTVIDDYGRSVPVPEDPTRVVVLGPNLVDSMVRLGVRSSLVGVDCSAASYGGLEGDYTPEQTANWSLTSGMCVQAFPSLDTEELLNDSPQVVLATSVVSESALTEFSVTYDVPVVFLVPASLDGIVNDVRLIATIFPSAAAAGTLESTLEGALASAHAALANLTLNGSADIPPVLLTYYVDPSAGYYAYGPGTFGDSLVVLAGARNIAANASVPYPILSGSEVLAAAPAVVLYGVGPLGEPLSAYDQGPDWSQLSAEKVPVDVTLFTEADPTMILVGLPQILEAVHAGAG
jgi:ABC-type Fe3+-hydroxamate transport system substrate-binding protein